MGYSGEVRATSVWSRAPGRARGEPKSCLRTRGDATSPGRGRYARGGLSGIGRAEDFAGFGAEPPEFGVRVRRRRCARVLSRREKIQSAKNQNSKMRKSKKKIAAPEFRIWSPTTLLGQALSSLTTVDRTGNGAFC